jgi:hypothetical protein
VGGIEGNGRTAKAAPARSGSSRVDPAGLAPAFPLTKGGMCGSLHGLLAARSPLFREKARKDGRSTRAPQTREP